MSKSFEDKLNKRLGDYSAPPPSEAKAAVLAALDQSDKYVPFYHYAGGLFLLMSLFMVGYQQQDLDTQKSAGVEQTDPVETVMEEMPAYEKNSPKSVDQTIAEKSAAQILVEDAPTIDEVRGLELEDQDMGKLGSFHSHQVNGLGFLMSAERLERRLTLLVQNNKTNKRIIPEKKAFFNPYMETGAFFLYNRLKPNLNDDIYVGDYDSPYGLSASRLGFTLNLGVQKEWTEKYRTRLGLIFNNYGQNFSFKVRNTTPDSVGVEEEYIQPYFDEEAVQISERVSTLGLKFQSVWAFPSSYNSLYLAFEYHRLLGAGPKFTYEGSTYTLVNPSQYLAEVGLKKRVVEFKKGELSMVPSLRYSVVRLQSDNILSVKPFSVGLSLSYSLK